MRRGQGPLVTGAALTEKPELLVLEVVHRASCPRRAPEA